jgi:hypothetical protein
MLEFSPAAARAALVSSDFHNLFGLGADAPLANPSAQNILS